jgi:hypothetical protein
MGSSENTRKLLKVRRRWGGEFSSPGVAKSPGHPISFRHFPSPPQSGPVHKPAPARADCARTPLVVRQTFDSIGLNSKMASFRHFLAAP